MEKKNVLLLGNGLNRLAGAVDWAGLMDCLGPDKDQGQGPGGQSLSSWPLEFERIYGEKNKGQADKEAVTKYQLKQYIQAGLQKILAPVCAWPLQSEFANLPVKHILTTNYDYNLEKAVNPQFRREKSPDKTKEKLFSLYRRIRPDPSPEAPKAVWHIHGEAEAPESICLGFEHYCAQLAAMRNLLTKPFEERDDEPPYLNRFLAVAGDDYEPESWPTLFFTHNVFIVGLDLSFMETDLWWLLAYRRQYQLRHPQAPRNKIVYFHPSGEAREEMKLMPALEVSPQAFEVGNGDWKAFYSRVLESVSKKLG